MRPNSTETPKSKRPRIIFGHFPESTSLFTRLADILI